MDSAPPPLYVAALSDRWRCMVVFAGRGLHRYHTPPSQSPSFVPPHICVMGSDSINLPGLANVSTEWSLSSTHTVSPRTHPRAGRVAVLCEVVVPCFNDSSKMCRWCCSGPSWTLPCSSAWARWTTGWLSAMTRRRLVERWHDRRVGWYRQRPYCARRRGNQVSGWGCHGAGFSEGPDGHLCMLRVWMLGL